MLEVSNKRIDVNDEVTEQFGERKKQILRFNNSI
jgi:hypothetical protein